MVYTGQAARGPRARVEPFLRAVLTELNLRADELDAVFGAPGAAGDSAPPRPKLASVYLGGGTPSLLAASDVAALMALIDDRFGVAAGAEVTIEANPGPDERGDLAGLRAAGVTRVSFGAQSLDAGELRRLGRRHRPGDVRAALEAARRAGIEHRSIDLLYDVPGQTMASWQTTVGRALELPIDHISAYALTLDDPTAAGLTGPNGDHLPVRTGARRWRQAAMAEQDDDRAADAYLWLDERLEIAGFGWYEISNWGRPGGASRHNQAYWQRRPTIGVGPGAHGFDGERRRSWNAARLDAYLAALLSGELSPPSAPSIGGAAPRLPPGGSELLDDEAVRLESLSLALRTRAGVTAADLSAAGLRAMESAEAAGLVEPMAGPRRRLTPRGRLLAGQLAVEFVA